MKYFFCVLIFLSSSGNAYASDYYKDIYNRCGEAASLILINKGNAEAGSFCIGFLLGYKEMFAMYKASIKQPCQGSYFTMTGKDLVMKYIERSNNKLSNKLAHSLDMNRYQYGLVDTFAQLCKGT